LAAGAGLEALAQRWLGHGACAPDATDAQGWTPLHCCALHGGAGRRGVATALLDAGAAVHARTPCRGRTPLHLAAAAALDQPALQEDAAMVRLLVANGAPLDAADGDGKTALAGAAAAGRVKCCEALLESGANPYHLNGGGGGGGGAGSGRDQTGRGALHWACARGQPLAVRLLAQWDGELGLHARSPDARGHTPGSLAANHPDPATAQAAQRALVSPWACARDGDVAGLQRLLVAQHQPRSSSSGGGGGYNGDEDGDEGWDSGVAATSACLTPPHLWAAAGFEAKGPLFGCTPLMLACLGARAPHILLHTLPATKEHAASVSSGRQRLLAAARRALAGLHGSASASRGASAVARLNAPGRPGSGGGRGKAAAAAGAQLRTVEFLLQRCGVYVDAGDRQGRTALMLLCVAAGDTAAAVPTPWAGPVATALLRGGARSSAADLHGNTALHYAFAFAGHGGSGGELLPVLLAAGAQPNARNFAGQTPKEVVGLGGDICREF
jgi:ankyrin repeat protein